MTALSRRTVLKAGLAVGAGLAVPQLSTRSASAGAPSCFGLRLAYGPDASTSMIVTFGVDGPFNRASVRITGPSGKETRAETTVSAGRHCQALVSGLVADTVHDYTVELDGVPVAERRFRTAPTGPMAFRFTAFGDQGVSSNARAAVDTVDRLAPRLHLVTGGLAYADVEGADDTARSMRWDAWLKQNEAVADSTPWMCALSEHEIEPGVAPPGYADVLARVPAGGRTAPGLASATSFVVGQVGYLGLDSNDVSYEIPTNRGWSRGAQTRWAQQTLSGWRAPGSGVEFIVCYLHHSAYSTNRAHPSEVGIRDAWGALFDRYSVDLVLSSHNRCYERTLPVRARKAVTSMPNEIDSSLGTTYITVGGGGETSDSQFWPGGIARATSASGLRTEASPWSLPSRTGEYAVLSVDVTPPSATERASMQVRAVGTDAQLLDSAILHRGGSRSSGSDDTREAWWIAGGAAAVGAGGAAVVQKLRRDWRREAEGG